MHILVVEDEFLINLAASEELTHAGHDVVSAYSADEAIELLEAASDIDLIVTDIDMPGAMDGLRLAAAVRKRWPPMKIIVTSGTRHPAEIDLPQGGVFLSKPYLGDRLIEAIKTLH